MPDFENFAERMYEAAFLPELWTPLLDDLAVATGSGVGGIGIYWPRQRGITTSFQISPGRHGWEQSEQALRLWREHVRSSHLLNRGFFQLDPFRGDWSNLPDFTERLERHVSRGFGVQTGTILELFNGEIITLEFTRRLGEPRYEAPLLARLNTLHSVFRQSVFFASRLQFERARASIETLNDFGLPAALVNGSGQILLTNELFESVDRHISKTASGRVTIRGSDSLRKTFAEALEQSRRKSVSLPIPATAFADAAVIQLMPLCGEARSIFSLSCTVMVVCPVTMTGRVPSAELVCKLFGLTPTEARVAVALASGLSLRDSAANQGTTLGTVRSYLVRVFSKTGTNQQSELVSLIKSITPGPTSPLPPESHRKLRTV